MVLSLMYFLMLCIIGLCYLFIRKHKNHWKKRGVVEVDVGLFKTIYNIMLGFRSMDDIYEEAYKKNPDQKFFGTYMLGYPTLYVKDPELIGRILVKDFHHFYDRQPELNGEKLGRLVCGVLNLSGEKWKASRNKITPTFSTAKLKRMYCLLEECCQLLKESHLRPAAEMKTPIDLKEVMSRYSLDCVGSCAFGLRFDSLKNPDSQYRNINALVFAPTPGNLLRMTLLALNPKLLEWLGIKAWPDRVENFFFKLLEDAEKLRKSESGRRCDFLQSMLDIRDMEAEQGIVDGVFTTDHVASNMFVFYGAGFETTSNTLAFCLYELSINHDIQDKLRDEIIRVKNTNNGVIDYDAVKDMIYMDMVISETLRKHSPSGHNMRICNERYQLPNTSLILEPGDRIFFPMTPLHFDEKYYPNPQKFDPERFNPQNTEKRTPYTYLPFGDGPRVCLGMRFAKLEIKCCLASALSEYRFSTCEKTEIPINIATRTLFHTPKNGIWLNVEKI